MTAPYLISKKDLGFIISNAKTKMVSFNLPLHVSGFEIDKPELPSLAILESVLMFLNMKGLLVTQVSLEYTDPTCDHDPEGDIEE